MLNYISYLMLHVAWNSCVGMGWQVLSSLGLRPMSLPHATWSQWNSPFHFIQLDIEDHEAIQEFVHWFVFHQND